MTKRKPSTSGYRFVELLESREFLSASPIAAPSVISPELVRPIIVTPTPIGGLTLHEKAGVQFTTSLGTFVTLAPATNLQAVITWGDHTSSAGVLTPIGVVGVDQVEFEVDGTHTYARPGIFGIRVTVIQPGPTPTTIVRLIATLRDRAVVVGTPTLLDGTISGKYSLAPTSIQLGGGYVFDGTGTAGDLGAVSAHGLVTTGSPISTVSQAIGTLTLTQVSSSASLVNNSVTLRLVGMPVATPGAFPATLSYTIVGGTGAFAGATGNGIIDVTLNRDMSFSFVIISAAPPPAV